MHVGIKAINIVATDEHQSVHLLLMEVETLHGNHRKLQYTDATTEPHTVVSTEA